MKHAFQVLLSWRQSLLDEMEKYLQSIKWEGGRVGEREWGRCFTIMTHPTLSFSTLTFLFFTISMFHLL